MKYQGAGDRLVHQPHFHSVMLTVIQHMASLCLSVGNWHWNVLLVQSKTETTRNYTSAAAVNAACGLPRLKLVVLPILCFCSKRVMETVQEISAGFLRLDHNYTAALCNCEKLSLVFKLFLTLRPSISSSGNQHERCLSVCAGWMRDGGLLPWQPLMQYRCRDWASATALIIRDSWKAGEMSSRRLWAREASDVYCGQH